MNEAKSKYPSAWFPKKRPSNWTRSQFVDPVQMRQAGWEHLTRKEYIPKRFHDAHKAGHRVWSREMDHETRMGDSQMNYAVTHKTTHRVMKSWKTPGNDNFTTEALADQLIDALLEVSHETRGDTHLPASQSHDGRSGVLAVPSRTGSLSSDVGEARRFTTRSQDLKFVSRLMSNRGNVDVGDHTFPYKKPPGTKALEIRKIEGDIVHLEDGSSMHISHASRVEPGSVAK